MKGTFKFFFLPVILYVEQIVEVGTLFFVRPFSHRYVITFTQCDSVYTYRGLIYIKHSKYLKLHLNPGTFVQLQKLHKTFVEKLSVHRTEQHGTHLLMVVVIVILDCYIYPYCSTIVQYNHHHCHYDCMQICRSKIGALEVCILFYCVYLSGTFQYEINAHITIHIDTLMYITIHKLMYSLSYSWEYRGKAMGI